MEAQVATIEDNTLWVTSIYEHIPSGVHDDLTNGPLSVPLTPFTADRILESSGFERIGDWETDARGLLTADVQEA